MKLEYNEFTRTFSVKEFAKGELSEALENIYYKLFEDDSYYNTHGHDRSYAEYMGNEYDIRVTPGELLDDDTKVYARNGEKEVEFSIKVSPGNKESWISSIASRINSEL
jgi:hypothetical protein